MAGSYTVALVGFPQNESTTFESFFRLAARRPPSYVVQDEVMDAQILVVNADNLQAVHLVQHADLPGKVLLIGNSDGGTGWPLQRKPVKLVAVLAALDAIVGVAPPASMPQRAASATGPVATRSEGSKAAAPVAERRRPAASLGQVADRGFAATEPFQGASVQPMVPALPARRSKRADSEFPATRPMPRSAMLPTASPAAPAAVPAPAAARRPGAAAGQKPGVMRLTDFGGLDELPAAAPASVPSRHPRSSAPPRSRLGQNKAQVPEVQRGDMLLVAESLVEGRILHKRFKRYGLSIDWSREAPQALVMLKAHPYRLVVIDRLNGEPDAYQVCRAVKQQKRPTGAPVVIMFAPTAGSMDRMKAGLAGSDAYLSRSVGESELYKVLAQHRLVSLDGFERTNIGF